MITHLTVNATCIANSISINAYQQQTSLELRIQRLPPLEEVNQSSHCMLLFRKSAKSL